MPCKGENQIFWEWDFFRNGGSIFEHIAHYGKNKQNND